MRIGFIGCVESSACALKTLLSLSDENVEVVSVITRRESRVNSDHVDLAALCKEYGIPCHYETHNTCCASIDFLKKSQVDIIYCFGWSYLLGQEMLHLAPMGVIGFHPAKLPQNRGRHPIIWALSLGLDVTASTFFRMEVEADSGPILSQVDVPIKPSDDASSLYKKILEVAQVQVVAFTRDLANGVAKFKKQDHEKATNWRKRSRNDGLIDWRMQADDIHNLIRALVRPYPGAEFLYKDTIICVWKSAVDIKEHPRSREPGYVLAVRNNAALIKCGGASALWLYGIDLEFMPKEGEYL